MIYDHRTYAIYPGKMNDFLEAYENQGYPIQKKYLEKCHGWFVSMDIGALNQVVHIWAFTDLNDRAARRAKMAADPAWGMYLAVATPFIQTMENKILSPAPFFDVP
ncbi:MAG: NIPSNAP family protein [Gammaproteobacteria bacterium]